MKIESLQVQVVSQRNASQLPIAQTTVTRAMPPLKPVTEDGFAELGSVQQIDLRV